MVRRNLRNGLLFASPFIVGFLALRAYPIFYSIYLSTTEYNGLGTPTFVGFANYKFLLADKMFLLSVFNTLYYTVLAAPVGIVVAIIIALAMNQKVREVAVYRAILYLPSILPSFALVFVWILFTNPQYGLMNQLFIFLGLPFIDWVGDPRYTKLSLVILAQYGAGGSALLFLASLRSIPKELYESAEIDGAGIFKKFIFITLPLITPMILYCLIIGVSNGLQAFTQAYIIANTAREGTIGPADSLLFYVYYVYRSAFYYSRMGYAATLSIVLFLVSLLIAMGLFKWGRSWVHYESE
jgi:multiple sugar transport system permease protein